MTNSRLAAIKSLSEILDREGRPKQALEQETGLLDRRDRAFVMEIVYGVLRNLSGLDYVIRKFVKNPSKLGRMTENNLRTAVYQMFFMRVPVFAVVHEAVESEKNGGKPSLVNAVLRNILRRKPELSLTIASNDPAKDIAHNFSHPEWMVRRWISWFGAEGARSLAAANNSVPPLIIRANTVSISRDALLKLLTDNGIRAVPTTASPEGIRLDSDVSYNELSEFRGMFSVQDEASQLISHLLAPERGERVLDACAAPGGKTVHIAQLMDDSGEILAVDRDPLRLEQVKENISEAGTVSVRVMQADSADLKDTGAFDRILLDAPCSSTGVIRRNPDVRYRLSPSDPAAFGKRQLTLLRSVSGLLRDGGRLVYSVCSIEPEEGPEVIGEFLKTADEFRIIEAVPDYLKTCMTDGFFRTYPHLHDMDGFFGVILCRKR